MINVLLDHGADVHILPRPLWLAIAHKQVAAVKILMTKDSEIDMYDAVSISDLPTVQELCKVENKGPILNMVLLTGRSVLDIAKESGHQDVADYLQSIGFTEGLKSPPEIPSQWTNKPNN